MKKSKWLSAMMLSISAVNTLVPAAVSAGYTAGAGNAEDAPAVLKFQAVNDHVIPQQLRDFEKALTEHTGLIKVAVPMQDLCGSISGSGNGWDDSSSDCHG